MTPRSTRSTAETRRLDGYFKNRKWFDPMKGKASPETYRFEAGPLSRIGYAAAGFANRAHPDDAAPAKARYLVVFVIGIDKAWQGHKNPDTGSSYAVSIMQELEALARARAGCVGLCLWVRSDNGRAIKLYKKCGFAEDPGGPVQRDTGAPHVTMRLTW